MNINQAISSLLDYAKETHLIEEQDFCYSANRVAEAMGLGEFSYEKHDGAPELCEILDVLCDEAYERGLIENNSVVYRDLFDTKIMGLLMARPSEVVDKFYKLYADSAESATDYFYKLSCDSNYIRRDRIRRDLKWQISSEYGDIDITVNLSKPEKDPKAIMAAKSLPQSDYPKCLLCHENEGFAGNLSKPARQTLRQIPFTMAGADWYLQYSPYVYYNEHCIALSSEHTPMNVNCETLRKILNFVECFPHYFIGSNAGLPIVGGSILSHDHMQGGRYDFAMAKAPIELPVVFRGFEDVKAGLVRWPMAVIRICSEDKERVAELGSKILLSWQEYTDEEAFILANTDGEDHNAVTPIGRRRGKAYELDIVLRNNITTEEFPLGYYHPHPENHNVKKENIGLIEVMGLAVLPARLKSEMEEMKRAILSGEDFANSEEIVKHKAWFEKFRNKYSFTEENVDEILKEEVGKTFVNCLRDASVYKDTPEGKAAFLRFINFVNS